MAENFSLPTNGQREVLPSELDENWFSNLDSILQRQEKQQMERVQGTLENQGFFRSGQNFKDVSEQVLGPSLERRSAALLPLAQDAALRGREERLGTLQFERQRQFADEEFNRRLQEIDKRAQVSRMLMELDSDLRGDGGGWGDLLGGAAGMGIGALFGGAGAGIGASLGSRIGSSFNKKPSSGSSYPSGSDADSIARSYGAY